MLSPAECEFLFLWWLCGNTPTGKVPCVPGYGLADASCRGSYSCGLPSPKKSVTEIRVAILILGEGRV